MKLFDDLFLVGGGPFNGFGLSNSLDCHVYALNGGDAIALIDCGMATAGSIDRILLNLQNDGLDVNKVTHLFLTHYHIDHCGGINAWQKRFPIKAFIGADVITNVLRADVDATGFKLAQEAGFYPSDYNFVAPISIEGLKQGDVIKVGNLEVQFISTPGHCNGHGCYLVSGVKRYLFSGDCIFAGGKIALLNTADSNIEKYRTTIFNLEKIDFDALLPGHGAIVLRDGKEHVKVAANSFRKLLLPENFV